MFPFPLGLWAPVLLPVVLGGHHRILFPYDVNGPFKQTLLSLFRLAWSSKVQLPLLITVAFLAFDIHLQMEINIFWEANHMGRLEDDPRGGGRQGHAPLAEEEDEDTEEDDGDSEDNENYYDPQDYVLESRVPETSGSSSSSTASETGDGDDEERVICTKAKTQSILDKVLELERKLRVVQLPGESSTSGPSLDAQEIKKTEELSSADHHHDNLSAWYKEIDLNPRLTTTHYNLV